jgi:predicted transcriptional regulator
MTVGELEMADECLAARDQINAEWFSWLALWLASENIGHWRTALHEN